MNQINTKRGVEMKRKLLVVIAGAIVLIAAVFSLIRMSNGDNQSSKNSTSQSTSQSKSNSKTLIIYFSLSGNTKKAAEQIKKRA